MPMDRELREAASSGDVDFLIKAVATKPANYFLAQVTVEDQIENPFISWLGNIIQIAMWNNKGEFVKKAIEILPTQVNQKLLCQSNSSAGWTPLHIAAGKAILPKRLEIIRLILNFCKSHTWLHDDDDDDIHKDNKLWLAPDPTNQTPLHVAMGKNLMTNSFPNPDVISINKECAMEILSMDLEVLCRMVDANGNSPLFLAVQLGFTQVAEKILMSSSSYHVGGENGSTPLHFAPNCSENVLSLLLKKHQHLMDTVDNKGYNVLHQWAEIGEVWPLTLMLEGKYPAAARSKVFQELICQTTEKSRNDNPLQLATWNKKTEVVKTLVQGYQQETRARAGDMEMVPKSIDSPPWTTKNIFGNTCLHLALINKIEELALIFISLDSTTLLSQGRNQAGLSPLTMAVAYGFGQVVEEILRTQEISYMMLTCNDGTSILHGLSLLPENIGRKLLGKFWWLSNLRDNYQRTALDYAIDRNCIWLINLLMNPSLIQKEPFDWIKACDRKDTAAILAFIDTCDDLLRVCRERNDTPLHHIRLPTYKDYLNFLKLPAIAELKNMDDSDGATPLHRALERKDMPLAKALLVDNRVERNVADYHGITAMNQLAKLCKEHDEWDKMCKDIEVNPNLKTNYIQPGTNMDQMRNTLSVVAALLATITFAAGFTLPGGLNQETGDALLAEKAAFLVFLLSDAYAMCTSMLVLFCLIWSMVSTRDMSYLLVDRSVFILMQALYSTMVAFMTGIYVVIGHSSLWAAIIIFIMCSFIGISANRTVLHNVLAKLIPATNHNREHQYQMLDKERASGSRNNNNQNSTLPDETESVISTGNHEQGNHNPLLRQESIFISGNVQNSTSSARYQDHEDQAQLLEQGDASTSHMMAHRMYSKIVPENDFK